MSSANYDVIIVGCGPAGVSAAIGLGRMDFSVLVIEGAPFPGAENWSGAIYFTENLAHPDLLGPRGVEDLPFERRIVRRGMLMSNGHSSFGLSYRNAETFAHNYSVLRPTYDHYLAEVAKGFGATILSDTTAMSLIRHRGRIIGVHTDRGPFYSDLVFLAEGDASHLVSQEGYERLKEPEQPHFLQGIREVIPMPPAQIESLYGVGAGEGAAFEILVRNPDAKRRGALNIGGFLYTNRDSLSVGLVLPLDLLASNFGGDHNLLMEWFKGLPEIQRLTGGARAVSYGAKIIRGGGYKEIPTLVDHGLAIGGAASGIGTDFPYPNFTGPATFMGLQIARAAREIRRSGGEFTREALEKFYLAPLRASHYHQNLEYLRDWPGYVERTTVFFGCQLDAVLGPLYALSRPECNAAKKFWHAAKMVREAVPRKRWGEFAADARALNQALKLTDLLRCALAAIAFRSERFHDSATSSFNDSFAFHYSVEGAPVAWDAFPFPFRRFFVSRFTQRAMRRAADALYRNDRTPLKVKLRRGLALCLQGLCPLEFALLAVTNAVVVALVPVQWVCEKIYLLLARPSPEEFLAGFYPRYRTRVRALADLSEVRLTQSFEEKLAMDTYFSEKTSHIHVLRPETFEKRAELISSALWHVCPAKVYEVHPDEVGQSQVSVNFENCIKCESCWRGSPDVDWSRARRQRLIYRVFSPASEKLFSRISALRPPIVVRLPKSDAPWMIGTPMPQVGEQAAEVHGELQKLRSQLESYRAALARSPRALTRDDQAWLQQIAFYASTVSQDVERAVCKALPADAEPFRVVWSELRQRLAQMQVHVHRKKFFWADADAAQMLDHHLSVLRRLLPPPPLLLPCAPDGDDGSEDVRSRIRLRVDAVFDKKAIKDLEKGQRLTEEQQRCLRDFVQRWGVGVSSAISGSDFAAGKTTATPSRCVLLEELARKDPSLALLISHHLLASEMLGADPADGKWRALAYHGIAPQKVFVFTALAEEFAVIEGEKIFRVSRSAAQMEPVQTLGLAATQAAHLTISPSNPSTLQPAVFRAKLVSDLVCIVLGMGRYLLERALSQAQSRVQFPATFRDEDGREGIAKFGAVKQMLSEMEADVYLLETLSRLLSQSPTSNPQFPIPAIALLVGELIGTQPGSLAYNCGQIFGGTAYSEDDVISKFYRDSSAFAFLVDRDIEQRLAVAEELARGEFPLAPTADERAILEDAARRGVLRHPVEHLLAQTKKLLDQTLSPSRSPFLSSCLGAAAARWWGAKLALLRTAARLGRGEESSKQVECCRLLADRAELSLSADVAGTIVEDGNTADRLASGRGIGIVGGSEFLGREILAAGYFDEPPKRPLPFSYAALCREEQTYESGDYLLKPFGSLAARYLPEHLHLDRELAAYNQRVRKIFSELAGRVTDGLRYSRYVEKLHAVPDSEIQMLLREGFMRMFVPKDLGGEGRWKAEYYILVTHSMRLAEPGIALTIQAHQSIGVTPVLLGLFQDLPRAKHELQQFLRDEVLVKKLDREIAQMLADLSTPAVLKIKERFTRLGEFVRDQIGKRASLRGIGSDFLEAFMAAGRAGLRMDLRGFEKNLQKARAILPQLGLRAQAELAELTRREEAHKQFLRYIAKGAISCFALTEPSAGSDTASVGTRAHRRRVEVFSDKDGSKYFFLDEKKTQRRRVIPADQWDLRPPPPDTDVAQIRREGDREFYEYYELNGAKMWITNAHIAGAMAMYARTEVGPTGFMLRAPVEGLTVGNDELKMGQRGSPTNELGLSGVRVPRENIIGIEGRGQVNALETLNVGRMGLAVSSMAMMQKIIEQTCAFVREHRLNEVRWVPQLLGQMTEELYAVESLAFEMIGLADHKGTRSNRVESAIAKYYGAEALHRVIRASLSIHGILGQTTRYEIEKHLRDARILNIYEGTNEVQRFLILRDLVETLLPKWRQNTSGTPAPSEKRNQGKFSSEISLLEACKTRLFNILEDATRVFGSQIWNNPNFQPIFFPLAEIAGFIKLCDSVIARTLWLESNLADSTAATDRRHLQLAEAASQNFLAQTFAEIERLFARVHRQLDPDEHYQPILRRGFYPPEIRIATLALREQETHADIPQHSRTLAPPVSTPLRIAVVVQPQPVLSPRPQVLNGKILEPCWTLPPADRRALALALRTGARIAVLARGPAFVQDMLRRVLAAGADEAIWVQDEAPLTTAMEAARQIEFGVRSWGRDKNDQTEAGMPNLIVVGDETLGAALAGRLGLAHVAHLDEFSLKDGALELRLADLPARTVQKQLPLLISVAPSGETCGVSFGARGFLASFTKPLQCCTDSAAPAQEFALPEAPAVAEKVAIDSPEAAAKLFVAEAQIGGAAGGALQPFDGDIQPIRAEEVLASANACFVAVGESNGGGAAAAELAARCGWPLTVLVFCDRDETAQRQQAARLPMPRLTLVPVGTHRSGVRAALEKLLAVRGDVLLMGGTDLDEVFAEIAGRVISQSRNAKRGTDASADAVCNLILNVQTIAESNGELVLASPALGGKLNVMQRVRLPLQGLTLVTLQSNASFTTVPPPRSCEAREGQGQSRRVFCVAMDLGAAAQPDEIERLRAEARAEKRAETIRDAECLIDVGYAIRTREQFEQIVTPLERALKALGVSVMIGGTRKVVEELKLLRHDQQIGQTGLSVNPRVMICLGVSGAPQHVDYIGERAVIFAFNKDAQAPLMTLNQRRKAPKVHPIVGDLYETLPRFLEGLRRLGK